MKQEDEIEMILNESELICTKLNKALFEGQESNSLKLPVAFYAVARFAAQFLYDTGPSFEGDPLESFNNTVRNILKAYQDEGRDETYRVLKYKMANPDLNQEN